MEKWEKEYAKIREWIKEQTGYKEQSEDENGNKEGVVALAEKIGVHYTTLYRFFKGESLLKTEPFLKLILMYGGQILTLNETPKARVTPKTIYVTQKAHQTAEKTIEAINKSLGSKLKSDATLAEIIDTCFDHTEDPVRFFKEAAYELWRTSGKTAVAEEKKEYISKNAVNHDSD